MIDLVARLDEETAKRIKEYPHPNNRASEAGHPCERFLVALRLEPDKKALHGLDLQLIFDEGKIQEKAVLAELEEAGIKVVQQQRPFEWRKFQLTGHIDGLVEQNGDLYPLEIKSASPASFRALEGMAAGDLVNAKATWVRKYPAQILLYLLMAEEQEGMILFKNKVTGKKLQRNFDLDGANLAYAEATLQKLERVNKWVASRELPPATPIEECKGCPFAHTLCYPDQDYGPGFEILMNDSEAQVKLERWDALRQAAEEFGELDDDLKATFRGRRAIVGDFMIESKPYELTTYKVPKEIKEPFAEKRQGFRTTINRI